MYDFREVAGENASTNMFVDHPNESTLGGKAIAVVSKNRKPIIKILYINIYIYFSLEKLLDYGNFGQSMVKLPGKV